MDIKVVMNKPSLGSSPYYALEVNIAGVSCNFRMSDRSYSHLVDVLTNEYECPHNDMQVFKAFVEAIK